MAMWVTAMGGSNIRAGSCLEQGSFNVFNTMQQINDFFFFT